MEKNGMRGYLSGYLTVQAEGIFLERFLNICLHRGLDIKNVKRLGAERLIGEMALPSFRKIRPVCFRTKTRVKILKRHGLPFLAHRYRKRKVAILGLVLAGCLLWYTSGHIMGITVLGNEKISTETILQTLARSGVAPGRAAKNLDADRIRNQMMRDLDDLAWIGINVNGSRVYVEVVERLTPEERIEKDQPCHLVAEKDGVIQSIEAKDGQTQVMVGSGVREGDVLVSGVMDNPVTGYRSVHAYGEVIAQTVYRAEGVYPLTRTERTDTGKVKKRYTLKILNCRIPLYFGKDEPYPICEKEEWKQEYRAPVDSLPSLFIIRQEFREQREEEKTRTVAELLELANQELTRELEEQIPEDAQVQERELTHTVTEQGTVEVCMTVTCLENIAREVSIEEEKPTP